MAASPARRLLIDCSYIDFSRQPTGIPRVVLKYIEVGYAWGEARGVEVLPVVPTADGVYICRPLPGRSPPKSLADAVASGDRRGLFERATQRLALMGWIYLRDILHHFWFLIASILRLRPVRRAAEWLDRADNVILGYPHRHFERARQRGYRIEPGAGDILFSPAYWHDVDPAIYRRIKAQGAKIVILVHDILPITHAEYYVSPWRDKFRQHVREALRYADAFLTVSNYTRTGLVEFGVRSKEPIPPIAAAYNGYEPLVAAEGEALLEGPNSRLEMAQRFDGPVAPLIMVGSIEPKKGHIGVLDVLEPMWSEGYPHDLVIIGRRGWMEEPIVQRIQTSPYYKQKVFWLSDLDDFDLAYAYRHAHALVFASVGEGFGIPMIEAASLGCPAVVLETPIAREVLGDNGVYWGGEVTLQEQLEALESPALRQAAQAKAREISWPSWDAYTPKVLDQLLSVATDPASLPAVIAR